MKYKDNELYPFLTNYISFLYYELLNDFNEISANLLLYYGIDLSVDEIEKILEDL
jgi:hypothetical protein